MTSSPTRNPWLKCRQPHAQETIKLFCFPYAGANAAAYHGWADALGPAIGVCPVQLPGRAERLREPPYTDFRALISALVDALADHLDAPLALYGHSMGGFLAYELARTLRHDYAFEVFHLIVSGLIAPSYPFSGPYLSGVSDEEFKAAMLDLNGTPPEVLEHEELFQLLLPALRADFALIEGYRFEQEPLLDCPITVLGAHDDPRTMRERLEAWGVLTSASMTLHMLPGDHFFIHSARPQVLRIIMDALTG